MEDEIVVINSDDEISKSEEERLLKLAQAIMHPIHRRLDYSGIARKMFIVEPMPQGALSFYGKDDK